MKRIYQQMSNDSNIIVFIHKITEVIDSNEPYQKYKVQISFNNQKRLSQQFDQIDQSIKDIYENFIIPMNQSYLINKQSNTDLIIKLRNVQKPANDNLVGFTSIDMSQIVLEDHIVYPKTWLPIQNNIDQSKISAYIMISVIFIKQNKFKNLDYFWEKSFQKNNKDIKLNINDIPGYLNFKYQSTSLKFYFIEYQSKAFSMEFSYSSQICKSPLYSSKDNIDIDLCIPVFIPKIDDTVNIKLYDKEGQLLSTMDVNINQFLLYGQDGFFSLNFYDQNDSLLAKILYKYENYGIVQQKFPIFKIKKIYDQEIQNLIKKQDDKETFFFQLRLNYFISNIQLNGNYHIILTWGNLSNDFEFSIDYSNYQLIDKQLMVEKQFVFSQESYQLLPDLKIELKKNDEIIFDKNLTMDFILDEQNNQLVLQRDDQFILFDIKKQLGMQQIKFNNYKQETIEGNQIYCINLISVKSKKFQNNQENQIEIIHGQNQINFPVKLNEFTKVNKRFQYQDRNDSQQIPVIIKIGKEMIFIKLKKLFCQIPQWYQAKDILFLISFEMFQMQQFIQHSLLSTDQRKSISMQPVITDFAIPLKKFSINLKFNQIRNYKSHLNIIKLKQPFLQIDFSAILKSDKKLSKKLERINKLKGGIFGEQIYFKEEVNLNFDLPTDPRFFSQIKIELFEKNINSETKLGHSKIDLFKHFVSFRIFFFKRLEKILKNIKNQTSQELKILELINDQMNRIEKELQFYHKHMIIFKINNFKKKQIINSSDQTQINIIKQDNYFHNIKRAIIKQFEQQNNIYDEKEIEKEIMKKYQRLNSRIKSFKRTQTVNYIDPSEFVQEEFQINLKDYKKFRISEKEGHLRYCLKKSLEESFYYNFDYHDIRIPFNTVNEEKFGELNCSVQIYTQEDEQFFTEVESLGYKKEIFKGIDKYHQIQKTSQPFKLRIYLTDLQINNTIKYKNLNMKIILDQKTSYKGKIINRKQINKGTEIIFELNEFFEHKFEDGFSKCVDIIFYEVDYEFDNEIEIGRTNINLVQRYNNKNWHSMRHKPIEKRELVSFGSNLQTGFVMMWLELFNKKQTNSFPFRKINRYRQNNTYEVRMVIWKIKKLDKIIKGKSEMAQLRTSVDLEIFPFDIQFKNRLKKQNSDMFYIFNNETEVDINYRFIWRFNMDKYVSNYNSLISIDIETNQSSIFYQRKIDFSKELQKVIEKYQKEVLFGKKVEMEAQSIEIDIDNYCSVVFSLEIINEQIIKKRQAGLGRNQPNANPFLAIPIQTNPNRKKDTLEHYLIIYFILTFILIIISLYMLSGFIKQFNYLKDF